MLGFKRVGQSPRNTGTTMATKPRNKTLGNATPSYGQPTIVGKPPKVNPMVQYNPMEVKNQQEESRLERKAKQSRLNKIDSAMRPSTRGTPLGAYQKRKFV